MIGLDSIQERSASLETCPWCAAKGQTRALRSYRINVQEFVTLCTDPQDVLASLVPPLAQPQTGSKRKSPCGLENGHPVPSRKRAQSEEAVSQNGIHPVIRITTTKLNGEDCSNRTKHTTPVQKEIISQSEPTDMEEVDRTLNYPLPERGGANGYHKDSDWPIPEEMDQKVLEEGEDSVFLPEEGTPTLDKGLPLPEKTVPTDVKVICPLAEAVFALEKTLSVPQVAVSTPEKISPPLHVAVSASKKDVAAPEKALAPRVTAPEKALAPRVTAPEKALAPRALTAPGEATPAHQKVNPPLQRTVSAPEKVVSAPEKVVSAPEKVVSAPVMSVSAPEKVVSAPEKVVSAPEKVVSAPEKVVSAPEKVVSAPEKVVSAPEKVVSAPEKVVSAPEKVVSAPEKVVSAPEKVVSAPEKVVSAPEKVVSAPVMSVSAPEKVVSAPEKVVSAPEKVVSAPEKVVSAPEKVVSAPVMSVSAPEKVVSAPEKVVSAPEKVVSAPEKVVSAPEKVVSAPVMSVSALQEAVSLLEETLPAPGEAVPTMEAVLVLQEALTVLEEASPGMKDGLSVLQKVEKEEEGLIALEKEEEVAALVSSEAVPLPAMVGLVPALEEDEYGEEDLPVFDEEEKIEEEECPPEGVCRPCSVEECPPEGLCRPCSVDLSQSKVPDEGHVASDEDDCPIRPRRRAQNARQLSSEDEEQEGSVKEEVLTPPPKKKRGRPRKTPTIKYTQEVLPDFDPEVISTGELVPVPGPHLFWRNENSLCWLDTLLVALVHCRTLRDRRPTKRPAVGQPVWDLCERYDRACGLITAHQHNGADGVVRVPSAVLQRVRTEMQTNETPVIALPLLLRADSWAEPLFQQAYEWQFECISTTCQHATNTKCKKTLTTFTKVVSDWHPLNAANQSRCSKCNKRKQTRMLVLERLSPVFVLHFVEGLPDNDLSVYSFTFQQQRYSVTTVLQYDQQLKHFVTWIRRPDGSWLEFDDLKHPDCVSHTKLVVPPREIHVVFWELETDGPDNPQTPCSSQPETLTSTSLMQKELKQPHLAKLFVVNESLDLSQTVSDDAVTDMDTTITAGDIDNNMDTTLTDDIYSPITIGSSSVIVEALTASDGTNKDTTVTVGNVGNASSVSATLLDNFEGLSHDDIVTLTLLEVKIDSEGRPLDDITPASERKGPDLCFLPAPRSETETPPLADEITRSTHEIPTESETPLETDDDDDDDEEMERPTSPDTASEFLPDSSDGPSELDSEELTPSPLKVRRGSNRRKMASNTPVAAAAKVVTPTSTPRTATPMALPGNCGDIILPSVVSMMSPSYVEPSTPAPEFPPSPPPPPHPKTPNTSTSLQSKPGLPPPPDPNSHWSYLLSRHPTSTSTPSTQRPPSQFNHVNHSTPNWLQPLSQSGQTPRMAPPNPDARLKKPPPLPKPKLSKEDNEALPVKAAEMYGGFQVRSRNVNTNINNVPSKTSPPTQLLSQRTDPQNGVWKTQSQPGALASRKPPIDNNTTATYPNVTSLPPSPGVTELLKISSSGKHSPGVQVSKVPAGLSETEALRYKLLKKLKAKKKKLEKLNQMLGYQGGAGGGGEEVTRRPDCTDLRSPYTVSSSTSVYDSPAYDEFFADLLSPATTASNLSPDSTGFLEMLTTNGQEGGGNLACGGNAIGGASQVVAPATLQPANHGVVMPLPGLDGTITTSGENFLEELISGAESNS
ncbi:unnamed protein product [Coregonus sp. 'balchen']|nr:unnamed protein product [Coregonus sp. 'balchen']